MVKIDGIEYQLSERKNKKLKAYVNKHWVHFGNSDYEQYFDRTKLLDPSTNHMDKERRRLYLLRSKNIRDGKGHFTYYDKESPNYHSIRILW
jgi:hypothetical protein